MNWENAPHGPPEKPEPIAHHPPQLAVATRHLGSLCYFVVHACRKFRTRMVAVCKDRPSDGPRHLAALKPETLPLKSVFFVHSVCFYKIISHLAPNFNPCKSVQSVSHLSIEPFNLGSLGYFVVHACRKFRTRMVAVCKDRPSDGPRHLAAHPRYPFKVLTGRRSA